MTNATGAFGNAGHNSLRAPGYFDVDVAVTREFRFLERRDSPRARRSV